ncbi:MAG TPA: alpha/beta hydrolase [Methyloceanibacter sp.]|nr:alpha/beta hydrolase [Methyloceanibacter sp.]
MKRSAIVILALLLLATAFGAFWLWTPDKPREELEAKYLHAPGDMVEVAGLRLHVRDTGPRDAPAVFMVHGFGSSLHTWEPWARALEDDYRVIRFDLPSSSLSPPDPAGDYTDARTMQVLTALMNRLGIEKASMIGNSIGGRIAWRFAAENPARVEKLVLISPDGFESPGIAYGQKPKVPTMVNAMQYALPKPLLRTNLAAAYGDPSKLTDKTVDRYYDLMLAPGVRGAMIARMKQTVREDPVPLLRRIQAPVLLVWGEKDAMIPFSNASDYAKVLPQSTLASFPELGHVPQEEAPEKSLVPVEAFLARR